MAKNVVVCFDGTANEFARDHTNVLKLFRILDNQPDRQVAFYHPGIGTMEAAAALTSITRKVTKILGLAIGYGLERDVADAYSFIMRSFIPGDKLFMFGFSRGAYTVRAVAAILHMYGLLPAGNEPMVPYAIRMMNAASRNNGDTGLTRADDFRTTFRGPDCKPHFVGVWDTVSSVGWIENPLKLRFTADNPDIAIGRHAVSIDERRAFFRSNLWRPSPRLREHGPRDIQQVWFPGVHRDVGGGYPEVDSGLSKYALEWMAREAVKAGLLIDRTKLEEVMGRTRDTYAQANPDATLHESLTVAWWPVELVPKKHWNWSKGREERRMNLARRRTLPKTPLVHAVAFVRKCYNIPDGAIKVETDPW
jgi:uncharacterized protein (DUF2235 family)